MKYIIPFLIFLFFGLTNADAQISFNNSSYKELQRKAKSEKKPYFIFFHADWCKPCKEMERDVFADSEVERYVKANYIAYEVDEKGVEKKLINEYWVTAYPTIILFDKEGKEIHRIDGFKDKKGFLETLKSQKPGSMKMKFSEFR